MVLLIAGALTGFAVGLVIGIAIGAMCSKGE
jgi:hypothetical protein